MKKIIQFQNPILEQKSKRVEDIPGKKTQKLIHDMLEILNNNPDQSAGLSAVQIGVHKRVIICRRMDLEENHKKEEPIWEIMINPKYISRSKKTSTYWEGCLSINKGNLFGEVTRPVECSVKYQDREGESKTLLAKDYLSHIVQHEIDHLNGILFLSYIKNPDSLLTGKELDEIYSGK